MSFTRLWTISWIVERGIWSSRLARRTEFSGHRAEASPMANGFKRRWRSTACFVSLETFMFQQILFPVHNCICSVDHGRDSHETYAEQLRETQILLASNRNEISFSVEWRHFVKPNCLLLSMRGSDNISSSFNLFYSVCPRCLICRVFFLLILFRQISSWRFLSFIALLMLSIQDVSSLPRFLLFACLGVRYYLILLTCLYNMIGVFLLLLLYFSLERLSLYLFSCVLPPITIFFMMFMVRPFLVPPTLPALVHFHTSDPYNKTLFITVFYVYHASFS
jgi:hypothetical protein